MEGQSERLADPSDATERRSVIAQATGMLMAQSALSADDAFEKLTRVASGSGRPVVDVAREMIENHAGKARGTTQDDLLSERMAGLARDLKSETSSESALDHVVFAARELIDGCDSAGVSLAARGGKVRTLASANEVHVAINRLQEECEEGPCLDALLRDDVVVVYDLANDERWSRWRPRAVQECGLRAMLSVRLWTHEDRVGTLDLVSSRANAFNEDDVEEAVAIGAHAAVAYASAYDNEHLTLAIANRTVIGQATGLIMADYRITSVAAFALLKRLSNDQNRKISEIATKIVARSNRESDLSVRARAVPNAAL